MPENININHTQLIKLIKEANAEAALNSLEKSLLQKEGYTDYYNEVILLSSRLHDLERDNRVGIIESQQYDIKINQINNALLELLDDLKTGKRKPDSKKKTFYWKILLVVLPIMGLIGAAAYYFLSPPDNTSVSWSCPSEFKRNNAFKVLVLPFHDELPQGVSAPHKQIIKRLESFRKTEKLDAQINTVVNDEVLKSMSSENEALKIGMHCHSDMVVWGLADNAGKNTAISASYSIISPIWSEQLSDFNTTGSVDTLLEAPLFSTINGATYQIESVLTSLLKAVVAFKNKDYQAVIDIRKKTPAIEDKTASLLVEYMNAESHQKLGNTDSAIDAYSKVLAIEPTSIQALNNRAHLSLKQKNLDVALTDFTSIINLDKADYETYYKRAEINHQLGNLGEAKNDLMSAKTISPKEAKPKINLQLNQIDVKIKLEKNRLMNERVNVPNDTSPKGEIKNDLIDKARVSNKVGDFKAAEKSAISILKQQPNNKEALRELIKSKYFQNKKLSISQLKKMPYLEKIDEAALKQLNNPVFNNIIRNESLSRYDFKVLERPKVKTSFLPSKS